MGNFQAAEDTPHLCPVCGQSYIPATESVRVEGTGPILMQLDDVCLKAGDGWMRAYTHFGDEK